jgi:predicted GNAT family acetyltransferase
VTAKTKTDDPAIWARIRAYDLDLRGRVATRVSTRHGFALRFPARVLWDVNFLYLERLPAPVSELLAEADEALAGLRHRMLVVDEPGDPAPLAAELEPRGWTVERHVAMLAGDVPRDRVIRHRVAEVSPRDLLAARREALAEDGFDGATVAAVEAADEAFGRAGAERCFATRAAGGSVAAMAKLYTDGATGQIEDVHTLRAHRGHGHAQAVVLAALEASRAAGHDVTFLWADEADWPRELYGRLGFSVVGRRWRLRRA